MSFEWCDPIIKPTAGQAGSGGKTEGREGLIEKNFLCPFNCTPIKIANVFFTEVLCRYILVVWLTRARLNKRKVVSVCRQKDPSLLSPPPRLVAVASLLLCTPEIGRKNVKDFNLSANYFAIFRKTF